MTKKMYEDLIKDLKRKNRWLIIGLSCVAALLIIMSIVAFSCFEFSYEYVEDTDTNIEQNAGDGEVNQNVDMSENHADFDGIYTICGTVIICVLIIVIGVCVVYGKSKNNNP